MKATHAGQVNSRRSKALLRLEEQLVSKVKTTTEPYSIKEGNKVPLTELDTKRIKKEIATLKSRITNEDVARSIKPKKYRGAIKW